MEIPDELLLKFHKRGFVLLLDRQNGNSTFMQSKPELSSSWREGWVNFVFFGLTYCLGKAVQCVHLMKWFTPGASLW